MTAPPAALTGPLLQAILSALPQLSAKQSDDATAVLCALITRDENGDKQKLAEKLIKWLGLEVGKATDSAKSCVPRRAELIQCHYPRISAPPHPRAWHHQHTADQGAICCLRAVPGPARVARVPGGRRGRG
jgi:hypothetical protein